MAGRATLVTVARAAGVSRQTVSNVLNQPGVVAPETAERVRRVIDEQGYRVNRAARQMRTRRAQLIGMRIAGEADGANGVVLERFLHALTAAAERHDQRPLLFTADDDAAEIEAYRDLEAGAAADAFVVTGTHHDDPRPVWLAARHLAFVTFGRPWGARGRHAWVDVDGAAGTAAATAHLLERGHRRVAFVGWPPGSGVGDDRRSGWLRALGGQAGPEVSGPDSIDTGRRAAADLAADPAAADPAADGAPTAFVCASDSLALGVRAGLLDRGFDAASVAGSVVGFDDTPTAAHVGLSSVRQPVDRAAEACVELLAEVLAGRRPEPVLLVPELVLR